MEYIQNTTPMTRDAAQRIMRTAGEVRGFAIKPNWDFILSTKGEEGIRSLERAMTEVGIPFPYREIRSMRFYPVGVDIVGMALMEDILHMSPDDFFAMGIFGTKSSLLLKIMMRYFISPEFTIREAPNIWRKHYTVGSLIPVMTDIAQGRVIVELRDLPIYRKCFCHNFRGYLSGVWRMVVNKETTVQESACQIEGAPAHSFLFLW